MQLFYKSFLATIGLCALLGACAPLEKRVEALEAQAQNQQVMDLRFASVEDRLGKVEGDINSLKASSLPSAKSSAQKPAAVDKKVSIQQSNAATQKISRDAVAEPRVTASIPADNSSKAGALSYLPKGTRDEVQPVLVAKAQPAVSAQPVAVNTRPSTPPVKPEAKSVAVPKKTASGSQAAYDQALALYNKGQYAKAQEAFSDFYQNNSASSLAANALYWKGECQYSLANYDSAIISFKDVAQKYAKHAKAADALLKVGYSYAQMKDMENAKFYWGILISDYPKSKPAGLARQRLANG